MINSALLLFFKAVDNKYTVLQEMQSEGEDVPLLCSLGPRNVVSYELL